MADERDTLEKMVLLRLMRLNAVVTGVVVGLLLGVGIFIATNWLLIKGGPVGPSGEEVVGPHLWLLGHFFIGYRVTFAGSFVGLAYGFGVGFVAGYIMAKLYNWIVEWRESRSQARQ